MSALRTSAENYLVMRRKLGFKLTTQGAHLLSFVTFCEKRSIGHITADAAIEWATTTANDSASEVYQARRLDVVRIFARHMAPLDTSTEIPPDDVLSHRYLRARPYLYSPAEIDRLIDAAGALHPPIRAATWQTLIGLLAVTGMRQGEACRLTCRDVDLDAGVVVINDTKFGKSRQVFLHPTAIAALEHYVRARDRVFPRPSVDTFLVNSRGRRLDPSNTQHTFAALVQAAGIEIPPGQRNPRLHDLRHVFTVVTMLDWYRDGGDVQARLPRLSTWLGHVDPKSTYWYVEAVPELMALAAGRLEGHTARRVRP